MFWRKGYAATTVGDLMAAAELGRQSLSNTFGDKRALFVAALELYRSRVDGDLRPLWAADAGLPEIRRYIEGAVRAQRSVGSGACILVVTAFGPMIDDPEVAKAVRAGATAVRRAFAEVLRRCLKARTVAPHGQPASTAAMLYSVLNGLSALDRTGGTNAERRAVLDHTPTRGASIFGRPPGSQLSASGEVFVTRSSAFFIPPVLQRTFGRCPREPMHEDNCPWSTGDHLSALVPTGGHMVPLRPAAVPALRRLSNQAKTALRIESDPASKPSVGKLTPSRSFDAA